jgi:chromosome segregation ATPase
VIELVLFALALLLLAAVTFRLRGRLRDLEAIDRIARADLDQARADVTARLEGLEERERQLAEREDACDRLAHQTAAHREALYKMTKSVLTDGARTAEEARRHADETLAAADRTLADAAQRWQMVEAFAGDPRIKRLLSHHERAG